MWEPVGHIHKNTKFPTHEVKVISQYGGFQIACNAQLHFTHDMKHDMKRVVSLQQINGRLYVEIHSKSYKI